MACDLRILILATVCAIAASYTGRGSRALLGARPTPDFQFGCDGDLDALITAIGFPSSNVGHAVAQSSELGDSSETTRQGAHRRLLGAGEVSNKKKHQEWLRAEEAKEKNGKKKHQEWERGEKGKEKNGKAKHEAWVKGNENNAKANERRDKNTEKSNKAKHEAWVKGNERTGKANERRNKETHDRNLVRNFNTACKGHGGSGCDACTRKMCSKYSCSNLCTTSGRVSAPKICVHGVGCITAQYPTDDPINAMDAAKGVIDKGPASVKGQLAWSDNIHLGHGGVGITHNGLELVISKDKKCSAKLAFRRFTNQLPSTLERGPKVTMDFTAHIIEGSICNLETKKCAFKRTMLACYNWCFAYGWHKCTDKQKFSLMQ